MGVSDLTLEINSVGCPNCRSNHRKALKDFLLPKYDQLCDTCKSRFEKNPMRILDCKSPIDQDLVKVNNIIAKPSMKVKEGDVIELTAEWKDVICPLNPKNCVIWKIEHNSIQIKYKTPTDLDLAKIRIYYKNK